MSERTSERCKLTSERASEWPSTQICIFGYSGPQWIMKKKNRIEKKKESKKEQNGGKKKDQNGHRRQVEKRKKI